MKKIVLFQMLVIVTLLSLFVTSCEKEPENTDSVTIESTNLPKSSGEDIFAGKTFVGRDLNQIGVKYEFDNEGSVIYQERYPYYMNTIPYVNVAKYKYAYIANKANSIILGMIHFKPIGYYIDEVLYTDPDEYANKLIADIKNDSISVSDDYTEILKKICEYKLTSTKFIRTVDYFPEESAFSWQFGEDATIRNISNVLYTEGTDISKQLDSHSFKTKLGVTSTSCSFIFTDQTGKNTYKELDLQIYECTKNKAKVVYTYLDETAGGEDNSEIHKEFKVAGYGKVSVDYKTELVPISSGSSRKEQRNYAKVKITDVDDNLKEYLAKELADITGTGEGLDVSSILDKEFVINIPAGGCNSSSHIGTLE